MLLFNCITFYEADGCGVKIDESEGDVLDVFVECFDNFTDRLGSVNVFERLFEYARWISYIGR